MIALRKGKNGMRLFGINLAETGSERLKSFLEDNYITAGYPGLGDLENNSREEICSKLMAAAYQGQELEQALGSLDCFVNAMQDGDYVLMADEEWVYLGDLGDYFYDARLDGSEDGTVHRRGVTWLKSLPRAAVNPAVTELLAADGRVTEYSGVLPAARIDLWFGDQAADGGSAAGTGPVQVDEATVSKALAILTAALHSTDVERQERAAVAILQYAK
jgi:predicted Mrr-cat superfamily restriction endonuclease